MSTALFLSALLLIILAFAVYYLTKPDTTEEEISKAMELGESQLLSELSGVSFALWVCFAGGLLLTLNYAITYFSGSDLTNITDWSLLQWSGAFIGAVVTIAITSVQKVLYSSPTSHKAGLLITTAILIFVIFSEISSPMEKEDLKVRERSQQSATYQATVQGISQATGNTVASAYTSQMQEAQANKAKHVFELGRCGRHAANGQKRIDRCVTYENKKIAQYQAQIDSLQAQMQAESQGNQSIALALVDKAKQLENNTDNHSALIKFLKTATNSSFVEVMMLAALILVVAFEAGFHFAGTRAGILKAALLRLGNEDILYKNEAKRLKQNAKFTKEKEKHKREMEYLQGKQKPANDQAQNKPAAPAYNVDFKPATAFTNQTGFIPSQKPSFSIGKYTDQLNPNTGTDEEQLDLFAKNSRPTPTNTIHPKGEEKVKNGTINDRTPDKKLSVPPSLEKSVADRTRTVSPKRTRTLSGSTVKTLDEYLEGGRKNDDLYYYIAGKVREGSVKPTMRPLKASVHGFLKTEQKNQGGDVLDIPPMPKIQTTTESIIKRMLKDGYIGENPDAGNGKPKYRTLA
jgi:hypothetical protein